MTAERLSMRVNSIEISPIRKLIDMVTKIPDAIRLHAGEPDFDTPAHIREAAKKASTRATPTTRIRLVYPSYGKP